MPLSSSLHHDGSCSGSGATKNGTQRSRYGFKTYANFAAQTQDTLVIDDHSLGPKDTVHPTVAKFWVRTKDLLDTNCQ